MPRSATDTKSACAASENLIAIAGGDHLDCVRWEAGLGHGGADQRHQRGVGFARLRAAAQEHGIAALQAEGGGIGGDVGPRLVDDHDDTDGSGNLL